MGLGWFLVFLCILCGGVVCYEGWCCWYNMVCYIFMCLLLMYDTYYILSNNCYLIYVFSVEVVVVVVCCVYVWICDVTYFLHFEQVFNISLSGIVALFIFGLFFLTKQQFRILSNEPIFYESCTIFCKSCTIFYEICTNFCNFCTIFCEFCTPTPSLVYLWGLQFFWYT